MPVILLKVVAGFKHGSKEHKGQIKPPPPFSSSQKHKLFIPLYFPSTL